MASSNKARLSTEELLAFARTQVERRASDPSAGRRSDVPLHSAMETTESAVAEPDRKSRPKMLEDLFYDTLKDIYYAERQILKALPKMAQGATNPQLKAAFTKHKEQTEGHVERLQQVFESIGKRARGKTCEAIEGIIAEGEEIMEEFKGTPARDAGLISSAQAVAHYEMTRYGTLKTWAKELGYEDAVILLQATLAEESQMDRELGELVSAVLGTDDKRSVA
jgi:ferritin-like metal-binding protein YciE